MLPLGFEPGFSAPEADVLSIELRELLRCFGFLSSFVRLVQSQWYLDLSLKIFLDLVGHSGGLWFNLANLGESGTFQVHW